MAGVQTELLFELHMDLDQEAAQQVGTTSRGTRLIGYIKGGTLEGPKLKGDVLPGGRRLAPHPSRWRAGARCAAHPPHRGWPPHLYGLPRCLPHCSRAPSAHTPRGSGRSGRILLADHAGLRDRSGEVRLAQPDRSGRCRHPHTDWAQVHGVHHPLSIRGDPKVSLETKGRGGRPGKARVLTSPGLRHASDGGKR